MDVGAVNNDGRADLVHVAPHEWQDIPYLRGAETICADLGRVRLQRSARATAAQMSESRVSAQIIDLRRRGLLSDHQRLRLVVRLQDEHNFSRSALREAVARRLSRPIVRGHEEANELWLVQDTRLSLRLGLRVPSLEPTRAPRQAERPGSLRPSVAAAMVTLAGEPRGSLLDPCCGSGTLLAEAALAGWTAVGGDNAKDAIAIASVNTPVELLRLDSRQLPFRDNEFEAVVSNLPFGHQYEVQGAPVAWYRRTLSEAIRVAPRAVVLAPSSTPFRQALGRLRVTLLERHNIEVLGRSSTIWVLDRSTRA